MVIITELGQIFFLTVLSPLKILPSKNKFLICDNIIISNSHRPFNNTSALYKVVKNLSFCVINLLSPVLPNIAQ